MPEKSYAMTTASFHRRNHGMDEATKAGIGATICSVLILAIVFLAMHTLPFSIGYVWTFARDLSSRDPNWKLVATEAGQ